MQFVGAAAIFYVGASYALGGQERVRYDLEVLQVGSKGLVIYIKGKLGWAGPRALHDLEALQVGRGDIKVYLQVKQGMNFLDQRVIGVLNDLRVPEVVPQPGS